MADQQTESRRVVVETPTARREVSQSESVRYPERSGVSSAALAAIVYRSSGACGDCDSLRNESESTGQLE